MRSTAAAASRRGTRHLRPGLNATDPHDILEARAAGWGIAATCRRAIADASGSTDARALMDVCAGDVERLTTKQVAAAAADGNALARAVLDSAWTALGWGIAQLITLVSPEVVVIGGGVSLIGEDAFFAPVRRAARQYVFPPVADQFEIVPAALGEEVVIHGALALARAAFD
ncbi:MAG: ROK family protein [Pirellulales bacterium]